MESTSELWQIYHKQLLGFISSKVNDKEIAKDILHEVFIKIHTKLNSVKDTERLRSWIYSITRNTIIDYYRTKNKTIEIPQWLENEDIPQNEIVKDELSLCLGYLIKKLPQKYKDAIQISEIEGKTQEELAKIENISLSGAKSRVQRGRKMLKQMIIECCEIELNDKERIVDFNIKNEKNCQMLQEKNKVNYLFLYQLLISSFYLLLSNSFISPNSFSCFLSVFLEILND